MNYNSIGIMLTNQCSANCRMCCLENKNRKEELSIQEVKAFLKNIVQDDRIKNIVFSGGEVFLENVREKLVLLVEYYKKQGKGISAETNAFWANSYSEAYSILKPIVESGLDYLTISYDAFHQEFISTSNIIFAYFAARDLGIQIELQTVILSNEGIPSDLDELVEQIPELKINFVPCYRVGMAKKNFNNSDFARNTNIEGMLCRKQGSFSVNSDGTIWPCCSPYVVETDLCIGNIREGIDYREALERIRKNDKLRMLRKKGFDYFLNNQNISNIPQKLISSCEMCSLLFSR